MEDKSKPLPPGKNKEESDEHSLAEEPSGSKRKSLKSPIETKSTKNLVGKSRRHNNLTNAENEELLNYVNSKVQSYNSSRPKEHHLQGSDLLQVIYEKIHTGKLEMPSERKQAMVFLKRTLSNSFIDYVIRKKELDVVSIEDQNSIDETSIKKEIDYSIQRFEKLHALVSKRRILTEQETRLWSLMYIFTPVKEIQAKMGISPKSVYTLRSRIFKKIRKEVSFSEIL